MENSLDTLKVYHLSRKLSAICWELYISMDRNTRYILGNQLIRAADSVGANIAEGYGRHHYRDSLKFYYYSRGSLNELKHWVELALERNLINNKAKVNLNDLINQLSIKLNGYITHIRSKFNNSQHP